MSSGAPLAVALQRNSDAAGSGVAMSDSAACATWSEVNRKARSLAAALGGEPETIGLAGANGVDWAIAFLGALLAGKTVVPIPTFFSAEQIGHVADATRLARIIAVGGLRGRMADLAPCIQLADALAAGSTSDIKPVRGGGVVTFTSGSTGRPKGVRLSIEKLMWTADALRGAIEVGSSDRYLSVLPLSMLLEEICAIMIPTMAGASVHFDAATAVGVVSGEKVDIAGAIDRVQPTVMVLVPQLLAALLAQSSRLGSRGRQALRMIAVGGAKSPSALLDAARQAGLPVHEGYGLSECCSVVALNTPGRSRVGTVGRPLPGIGIEIVDGEIVVESPSVMCGYLHQPDLASARWHTGDLGELTHDGCLIVHGRKDNLIVTANGRNVSPEWVEAALNGRVTNATSIVCQIDPSAGLAALVISDELARVTAAEQDRVLCEALADFPLYARPRRFLVVSSVTARIENLVVSGKPDRRLARSFLRRQLQENR